MITFKTGNLFDEHADALVNTVNTTGVMGKGIALQFKTAYPESYYQHKKAADEKKLHVGEVQVVPVNRMNGVKYVINFPTKEHWRSPSKLEWIESGLTDLRDKIAEYQIKSIALPPLGCGNGGLDWGIVKPLIVNELSLVDADIIIYEPSDAIKEILKREDKPTAPKLTPARAMLLFLLYKYRALGEFASEFAAEKLSYFLQRFGEDQLKLDFKKAYYGPYSGKIKHVLFFLNGYYIKGYEQKDTKPFESLELIISKKDEVDAFLAKSITTIEKKRLNTVAEFIEGFESPYGLELLATVDMIIQENKSTDINLIKESMWSTRKQNIFPTNHIELAVRHLNRYSTQLYQ